MQTKYDSRVALFRSKVDYCQVRKDELIEGVLYLDDAFGEAYVRLGFRRLETKDVNSLIFHTTPDGMARMGSVPPTNEASARNDDSWITPWWLYKAEVEPLTPAAEKLLRDVETL